MSGESPWNPWWPPDHRQVGGGRGAQSRQTALLPMHQGQPAVLQGVSPIAPTVHCAGALSALQRRHVAKTSRWSAKLRFPCMCCDESKAGAAWSASCSRAFRLMMRSALGSLWIGLLLLAGGCALRTGDTERYFRCCSASAIRNPRRPMSARSGAWARIIGRTSRTRYSGREPPAAPPNSTWTQCERRLSTSKRLSRPQASTTSRRGPLRRAARAASRPRFLG